MPSRRDNRVSTRGRNNSQQAEDVTEVGSNQPNNAQVSSYVYSLQLKGMRGKELEVLGYMSEEISHIDLVQDEVNWVLTAVVQDGERNYIMKVVCETAMAKEFEIRQAAFECLISIASTYYDVLETYMQTLFELTANAVKGDEENVERAFVLLREQLEMLFSDAFRSRTRTTMSKTLLHGLLLLHSPATGYSVVSPANFQRVMTALLESIKDSPHVAEKSKTIAGNEEVLSEEFVKGVIESFGEVLRLADEVGCLAEKQLHLAQRLQMLSAFHFFTHFKSG
ncbi:importin subunit beta-1 [Tanacetum coccineum]